MNLVLFDEEKTWRNLLPLTFTRPISKIRIGILTLDDKWKYYFNAINTDYLCQPYLLEASAIDNSSLKLFINSSILPTAELKAEIDALQENCFLVIEKKIIAFKGSLQEFESSKEKLSNKVNVKCEIHSINTVTDVFTKNGLALTLDFSLLTQNKKSIGFSQTLTVIGDPSLLFMEEGARAEACTINTSSGPVYLSKNSEVMEGCLIRGPFALGENSVLKLGAKIYGPTTIGPHSKVGGEVNNSVIFGYSNKAHDGFLGNSVIGEWCNLGADTNNSNLKNNYGNVKLYNYVNKKAEDSGLQFCGLIMGDYSKSGINTMFNTGTVVGVAANIYGAGFPPTHIPSFSWGGAEGFEAYKTEKLFDTCKEVYKRRGIEFSEEIKSMLLSVFKNTSEDRGGN